MHFKMSEFDPMEGGREGSAFFKNVSSVLSEGGATLFQCPQFIFLTKKCEIQTKSGPKSQESQTKSRHNLNFFRTGLTKIRPNLDFWSIQSIIFFKVRFV